MPAPTPNARESDDKDTAKKVKINRLRRVFYLGIKKIVSLLSKRLTLPICYNPNTIFL